jgi:hypothetical protein
MKAQEGPGMGRHGGETVRFPSQVVDEIRGPGRAASKEAAFGCRWTGRQRRPPGRNPPECPRARLDALPLQNIS